MVCTVEMDQGGKGTQRTSPAGNGGETAQQLGRTRARAWAGRTGSAGWSAYGCRLTFRFRINGVLGSDHVGNWVPASESRGWSYRQDSRGAPYAPREALSTEISPAGASPALVGGGEHQVRPGPATISGMTLASQGGERPSGCKG